MEIKWQLLKNLLYFCFGYDFVDFSQENGNIGNFSTVPYISEKAIAYLALL